ncbi:MAG: hypothetical protein IKA39_02445 [Clostridia bacterium]|nr:hypothetical protein [Clostridia bacterium]MBR2495839.1 hypothetical protein [Clostridia bacterium]
MKNKIFGLFKKSKEDSKLNKEELALLKKDREREEMEENKEEEFLSQEEISSQEELDVDAIDKEAVLEAILTGNDQKLIELLKGFNVEKEQILALKEQFLAEIKQSMYDEDLEVLNERFKGLNLTKITDIPNFKKFATLRSEGVGVVEAFTYANPQLFKTQESLKGYVKTGNFNKKSGGNIPIPENELKMWRSAFPNDSDEELIKRYNKAIRA